MRPHAACTDAETRPLRNPEYYRYELDVAEIAEVCQVLSGIRHGFSGHVGKVATQDEGRR